MESDKSKSECNEIETFLKNNFQILALIGVFTAVAKYSVSGDPNLNDVTSFLSILSTLLVIFLLLIFVVSSINHIIKKTRSKINNTFLEFTRSSISDIIVMIIVILVALIALTLIGILIFQYPLHLQLSLIIIEMLIGLVIAAIFAVFILLRVRNLKTSFISFLIVCVFMALVAYGMGLNKNYVFNIFSPSAHLIGLVIIMDVLVPLTFIKFLYYLGREARGYSIANR